jgi:hypothetical protein
MTLARLLWCFLRAATGLCALFVTLRGFRGAYGIEFRVDTIVSVLYVLLPCLSFFVFFFARRARIEVLLHSLIAVGYLGCFAFLNWRTCASFGYCTTVAATLLTTLGSQPVLAAFGVVIFSGAAQYLDARSAAKPASVAAN